MTKLLIDADYFFYRAASSSEHEHEYNEELTVIVGDFNEGKRIVLNEIKKLTTRFDSDDIVLFFTDRKNFRKDVDPNYKGNRVKRKPCGYLKLKKWGMETFPSVQMPSLEADDALGIYATSGTLTDFVLISPDKDMAQIPCRIYDLKTEYTQNPEDALRKVYEQALTGDQTDGYSGCKGVGPKRAGIILDKVKDENYWPAVVQAFEESGATEEDALRNLRLARILQTTDWDYAKETVKLFTP